MPLAILHIRTATPFFSNYLCNYCRLTKEKRLQLHEQRPLYSIVVTLWISHMVLNRIKCLYLAITPFRRWLGRLDVSSCQLGAFLEVYRGCISIPFWILQRWDVVYTFFGVSYFPRKKGLANEILSQKNFDPSETDNCCKQPLRLRMWMKRT